MYEEMPTLISAHFLPKLLCKITQNIKFLKCNSNKMLFAKFQKISKKMNIEISLQI